MLSVCRAELKINLPMAVRAKAQSFLTVYVHYHQIAMLLQLLLISFISFQELFPFQVSSILFSITDVWFASLFAANSAKIY